jgi:uncharacterized LabA/DUF88 family protein
MRSNSSLYVDAGYLLASAATRVTGTSLRNGIYVEYRPLVEALIQQARELSGLPVLRVHWYDSAKNGVPDARQERIGELPKVKLRLGRFGVDGLQKGVDLRIGLDLVAHARNGAADVFFLVSGDDDLTEAVEEAQVHGVQVVVLAVPNALGKPHAVSRHLIRAADELAVLSPSTIDTSVMKVEAPPKPATPAPAPEPVVVASPAIPTPADIAAKTRPTPTTPSPTPTPQPAAVLAYSAATGQKAHIVAEFTDPADYDDKIDTVVARVLEAFLKSADADARAELELGRPSIPRDIDRALLLDLSDGLGVYDLNDRMRFRLRDRFWHNYDDRG